MKKAIFLGVGAFLLAALMVTGAVAKTSGNSGKSNDKSKELKTFEKGTEAKSDSKLYKENTQEATKEMKDVSKEMKAEAKAENKAEVEALSEEIEKIAEEQEEAGEEVAEAIEEVETRNKFKTFLVGTDYKNLGQLRSSLVQNRNQIRKLTQLMEKTDDPAANEALQVQLTTLMQERERVKTVIQDNEEGFSVLGWVRKLFNGYEETPLENKEEEQLTEEVTEALEDVAAAEVPVETTTTPTIVPGN